MWPAARLSPLVGFNSQPPEGGWAFQTAFQTALAVFQLTAARRRLDQYANGAANPYGFQLTAARRRLGWKAVEHPSHHRFNSQPPEGGWRQPSGQYAQQRCFNSQPPEGGWLHIISTHHIVKRFQLTAARRRLGPPRRIPQSHAPRFNSQPPEGGWPWARINNR